MDSWLGGIDWLAFLPAALVVSLVPGANQILSLRTALRQGTADAVVGLTGRFAAFVLLVAAVAAGLGALLTASATALDVLRWVGVAYLGWLGVLTLRRSRFVAAAPVPPARPRRGLVREEFLVALTNPKALLLFAAFLPQFVGADPSPARLAVLGLAYIGVEAASALVYTVIGGRLRGRGRGLTARTQAWVERSCGGAFLGLAGALALDRRS